MIFHISQAMLLLQYQQPQIGGLCKINVLLGTDLATSTITNTKLINYTSIKNAKSVLVVSRSSEGGLPATFRLNLVKK